LNGVFQPAQSSPLIQQYNSEYRDQTPLKIWTIKTEKLTGINAHRDIEGPYKALMEHLDTNQFKDKMKADESLWIKDDLVDE